MSEVVELRHPSYWRHPSHSRHPLAEVPQRWDGLVWVWLATDPDSHPVTGIAEVRNVALRDLGWKVRQMRLGRDLRRGAR